MTFPEFRVVSLRSKGKSRPYPLSHGGRTLPRQVQVWSRPYRFGSHTQASCCGLGAFRLMRRLARLSLLHFRLWTPRHSLRGFGGFHETSPPPSEYRPVMPPLERWPTPSCSLLRGAVGRALLKTDLLDFSILSTTKF